MCIYTTFQSLVCRLNAGMRWFVQYAQMCRFFLCVAVVFFIHLVDEVFFCSFHRAFFFSFYSCLYDLLSSFARLPFDPVAWMFHSLNECFAFFPLHCKTYRNYNATPVLIALSNELNVVRPRILLRVFFIWLRTYKFKNETTTEKCFHQHPAAFHCVCRALWR